MNIPLTGDIVQISPKSIVDDACVSYATLDRLNTQIKPALDDLTSQTDFFSHYRLNLFNKRCPFWDDEGGMCGNIGCAVETLDNEEDIPEVWRASELGKLEGPLAKHPGRVARKQHPEKPLQGKLGENVGESCVVEYDDECDERDYCVPDDERAGSKGDYVSLLRNPERFTGYGGDGAKQVWDAIYRENCFQRSSFPHAASLGSPAPTGPAQLDFKHVLDAAARQQQLVNPDDSAAGLDPDGECLEKRVFYRVVSGMHASISAHLCWDFMNQSTGEWQPNPQCYASRLHAHPDRISNLYFNYALVTRAVAKLGRYVKDYTFCMDDETEDAATRAKVLEVTERAAIVPNLFDESLMFVNGEGPSLKEDFRNRFRNVSRLMDCVGCDKCRLWGKLQTAGYGTALKVLFEFDNYAEEAPTLKRTELVALFNTHARLGSSLQAIGEFRKMLAADVDEDLATEEDEAAQIPVAEKEPTVSEEEAPRDEVTSAPQDQATEAAEANKRMPPPRRPRSFSESFWQEFSLFERAVKLVLRSWVRAPKAA